MKLILNRIPSRGIQATFRNHQGGQSRLFLNILRFCETRITVHSKNEVDDIISVYNSAIRAIRNDETNTQ
jgi:hypothetical protein